MAQAPDHIDAVAAAHVAAFGHQFPDWGVAEAVAELRTHRDGTALPCSWIALDGADWCGTVSLLHEDHPRIHGLTPWLASLYVREQARGRGLGRALVAHALAAASRLQVPRLFLYCEPVLVDYYAAQGWAVHAELALSPLPPVVVMAIAPALQAG
jgi:predicted N-acetyltransferase YhbS